MAVHTCRVFHLVFCHCVCMFSAWLFLSVPVASTSAYMHVAVVWQCILNCILLLSLPSGLCDDAQCPRSSASVRRTGTRRRTNSKKTVNNSVGKSSSLTTQLASPHHQQTTAQNPKRSSFAKQKTTKKRIRKDAAVASSTSSSLLSSSRCSRKQVDQQDSAGGFATSYSLAECLLQSFFMAF